MNQALEALLDEGFQSHNRGQFEQAERCYNRILQQHPDHIDSLHLLGLVRHQTGRFAEAIQLIESAIAAKVQPCAILQTNLGAAYQKHQQPQMAAQCYQTAIQIQADYTSAHLNLARLLTANGANKSAAGRWAVLGNLLLDKGEAAQALAYFQISNELCPDQPRILHDLATALARLNRLGEAASVYQASLSIDGQSAMAWNNLGWIELQLGRTDQAIKRFERAIELSPNYSDAHMCLAMALLRKGNYQRGWAEYEWRWRSSAAQFQRQPTNLTRWTGDPLGGRRLLVESEQGIGDVIQFFRFVQHLHTQGYDVTFHAPEVLQPLLSQCGQVGDRVRVVVQSDQFDCYIPLLSLPHVLGCNTSDSLKYEQYLCPHSDRISHWRSRLSKSLAKFRIGIVWQGNANYRDDQYRSFSLQKFGPLTLIEGVELVCLQKGVEADQLQSNSFPVTIVDGMDEQAPFLDTAAIMAGLDLVIAPNSSLAHLAGALGVPVWVALSAQATDWRWLEDCELTPWYSSLRLFRQRSSGDWDEVFIRMYQLVAELVRNKHSN